MSSSIQISTSAGSFAAYAAHPRVTPAPAIVVVHEVFGVNEDLRQTCDELSAQGYLALCPDLFWRTDPGLSLTDRTGPELAKALALYTAFDLDKGVQDIATTIGVARSLPECNGKVGVVGYCMGGLLTYLSAARVGADAAVAYYPGNADKHLDEAPSLTSPLLVHLAEEDGYIDKSAQAQIREALVHRPDVQLYSYPGCAHAFARHRGIAYDFAAATLANGRTANFLERYLRGS